MTVRKEKRRDPATGRVREFWMVDVDVELPDGKRTRVRKASPVQAKRDAERYETELRRAILDGSYGKEEEVEKVVPLIKDFVPAFIEGHCRAEQLKPSTIASVRQVLTHRIVPRIGDKRLDEVTSSDVQRIKAELSSLSKKTVNNTLACLRVMLRKAAEWDVIKDVPCAIKLLKVQKEEMKFHDFDDYERLVEAAGRVDARIQLAILLGGEAGLRMGEIAALEWGRIVWARNTIVVAASDWRGHVTKTKSGKVREVPMTTRLAAALRAHSKLRRLDNDLVLMLDNGRAFHRDAFRKGIMRVERRAGLEVTGRVHILRHTFCAHLAMRGAPAKAIQELAGHADLSTTMGYMHLTPSARAAAIGLLERRGQPQGYGNLTAMEGTNAEVLAVGEKKTLGFPRA
ncbi:site-specific integrase [Patescibacteria group bacterium]|nr:MAG: site-specific integrase [Patescibacteria group bacterium]